MGYRFKNIFIIGLVLLFASSCPVYAQADNIEEQIDSTYNLISDNPKLVIESLRSLQKKHNRELTGYQSARIHEYLGSAFEEIEDFTGALIEYSFAIKVYEELDSIRLATSIIPNVGALNCWLGHYDKAINILMEGVRRSNAIGDKGILARTYQNIGMVYSDIEDIKMSLDYNKKALKLFEVLPNQRSNEAAVLQNIAILYRTEEKYDSAIVNYKKSLRIFSELNEITNQAILYNNLGVAFEMLEQHDSSNFYYDMALRIFEDIDFKRGTAILYFNIGNNLKNMGQYQEALNYFYKSQEISKKIELKDQIRDNYLSIAITYDSLKDYSKSLDNLYQAYYWRDTVFSIEQSDRIAELETIYETEKKENQILRLESSKERQRAYLLFFGAITLLLIVLVSFLLIYHRMKENTAIQKALTKEQARHFKAVIEAQENERKRLAGELHDSVGPLLSVTQLYISDLADSPSLSDSGEKELLDKSLDILQEACNETRNVSHNLMPGVLTRSGLFPAVKDLVKKVAETNKINIEFHSPHIKQRFDEQIEITFYRVFQELLNNILKHANADKVMIKTELILSKLLMTVTDNGQGFDVTKIKNASGIGWKNIYSRLSLIRGEVKLSSTKDGTTAIISAPVNISLS